MINQTSFIELNAYKGAVFILVAIAFAVILASLITFYVGKNKYNFSMKKSQKVLIVILCGFFCFSAIFPLLLNTYQAIDSSTDSTLPIIPRVSRLEATPGDQIDIYAEIDPAENNDVAIYIADNKYFLHSILIDAPNQPFERFIFNVSQPATYWIMVKVSPGFRGTVTLSLYDYTGSTQSTATARQVHYIGTYLGFLVPLVAVFIITLVSVLIWKNKQEIEQSKPKAEPKAEPEPKSKLKSKPISSEFVSTESAPKKSTKEADIKKITELFEKADGPKHESQTGLSKNVINEESRARLMGMINTERSFNITDARKYIGLDSDQIRGMIYEMVGKSDIKGHFEGDVFYIDSKVEDFITALDTAFDDWTNRETSHMGKK